MKTLEELRSALSECAHHAKVLRAARMGIGAQRFSAESVQKISDDALRLLDQSACRFAKLQDTLGLRALPGILDLSEEPLPESTPFGEKLQRLERLGVIESVQQWRTLRELRNQLAPEYEDAPALKAAVLNWFIEGIDSLLGIWQHLSGYVADRGWHEVRAKQPHPRQ